MIDDESIPKKIGKAMLYILAYIGINVGLFIILIIIIAIGDGLGITKKSEPHYCSSYEECMEYQEMQQYNDAMSEEYQQRYYDAGH